MESLGISIQRMKKQFFGDAAAKEDLVTLKKKV
jgi:hypothetical protein